MINLVKKPKPSKNVEEISITKKEYIKMMKMYREQRNFLLILIGLAGIGIIGV